MSVVPSQADWALLGCETVALLWLQEPSKPQGACARRPAQKRHQREYYSRGAFRRGVAAILAAALAAEKARGSCQPAARVVKACAVFLVLVNPEGILASLVLHIPGY